MQGKHLGKIFEINLMPDEKGLKLIVELGSRMKDKQWSTTYVKSIETAQDIIYLKELILKAKVRYFENLKGVPVEVNIQNNTIVGFRILEEVV